MQGTAETWDLSDTRTAPWYVRLFPSLTDFSFILPAFLLFVMLTGSKALLGDGDTGWHIRTGDWILEHKMVPTADFFSFTKPGQPWFAWEWGWDLLFAIVHRSWGLTGVVFLNVLLLCFISALLFRLIRRCSGDDFLAFLLTLVATCGCTIHWWARPHLFSWLFVLLFAHAICSAEEGNQTALHGLPLLTVIWTNIHGGFFIGISMLLASAVGETIRSLTNAECSWRDACVRARPYLLCAAGCILATFINPYTWHLHQHVYGYLLDSKLLNNIQEYESVSFHDAPVVFFEVMLLLGTASVLWCLQRGKVSAAVLTLVWAHLALVSGRNVPIFLLLAAPWIACMLRDALPRLRSVRILKTLSSAVASVSDEFRMFERLERVHVLSAAAAGVLAVLFASGRPGFAAEFDPLKFPAKAIPILQTSKNSKIFTYDQWADYLIYRLYPSTRVFMDGRSDFYGTELVSPYQHILSARYDWETDLQRFNIDTVLVKADAPLATVLKQSRNWQMLIDDGHLIIFRSALRESRPVFRESARFSSVLRNGENKLAALTGLQVNSSGSKLKTQERRS